MLRRRRSAWLVLLTLGAPACARGGPKPFQGFVDAPVSAVAAQVPGRVESVTPREGDRVRKDDVIAKLDSSTYEAQVTQAEANVLRAQQLLRQAEANLTAALPTVTGAAADIARAAATRDQADADFARVRSRRARPTTPRSLRDRARAGASAWRPSGSTMHAPRSP